MSAVYPRGSFTVRPAQHEKIEIGVDVTLDGTPDQEFEASDISGVNNNDYSFTIELDTDYTLQRGDAVVVDYPAIDNPDEPGEYEVELSVNEQQSTMATLSIK